MRQAACHRSKIQGSACADAPCRFQLINLRGTFQFRMITGGLGANLQAPAFNIVAQSPVINNPIVNEPVQVRCRMHACHHSLPHPSAKHGWLMSGGTRGSAPCMAAGAGRHVPQHFCGMLGL